MEQTVDYAALCGSLRGLTEDVPYEIANFANASALLWQTLPCINWAGFYFMEQGALVLGPFHGKPACIRIEIGRGVCGTAVAKDTVMRIDDVHQFPGHIACDGASRSELVIPIHKDGQVYGVLDIDSPVENRFTEEDSRGLRGFVDILEDFLKGK